MGGSQAKLQISPQPPTVIMMVGLQGAGKTTHAAKLASMYKKQGKRPLLVACDIYRPAAIKQLQVVGEQVGATVFERGTNDPAETTKEAIQYLLDKTKDMKECQGVFYWEPQTDGEWKPESYNSLGWNAYDMGAFQNGKPTVALDPFKI